MKSKKIRNLGDRTLSLGKQPIAEEKPHYHSLYQFLGEHPLPNGTDTEYAHSFYWILYKEVRAADLPEPQRRIRSNLLINIGIESGIINLNKGANL